MKVMLGPYGNAVEQRITALSDAGAADRIWGRDASFWGGDAERQRSVANRLGWLDIASHMQQRLPELQTFADEVREAGYTSAVVLGMGGSSLAPEVLRQSLGRDDSYPALYVLDTTEPATIAALVASIDVAHTLFFVSSKSGTTIEALTLFEYFHDRVTAAKRSGVGDNFVAITDEGTPLQELARQHGFRRVFTNPSDIGGRYSALSYFGLVPAAVAGMDAGKLLERAVGAEAEAREATSDALRLGAILGELARQRRDKATFIIGPEVAAFGLWVEQLIAESTGKLGKGILPVVAEPAGSPLKYGDDRVFVQMRVEGGYTAHDDSVIGALTAEGAPAIVVELEDPYDLGREFVRWEFATAVAGAVLEINPFDEPNVQESKDNTSRVLAEFESTGQLEATLPPAGVVAVRGGSVDPGVGAALVALLNALSPGDYFAITAYIQQTEHSDEVFSDMRALVRDALQVATTLGYGPRYLHSTGQIHKGGPGRGVFLQVTADVPDVSIPGRPYTFGQLNRAQSIGDLQSLESHGRPALRVHLGQDVHAGLARLLDATRAALGQGAASIRR